MTIYQLFNEKKFQDIIINRIIKEKEVFKSDILFNLKKESREVIYTELDLKRLLVLYLDDFLSVLGNDLVSSAWWDEKKLSEYHKLAKKIIFDKLELHKPRKGGQWQ